MASLVTAKRACQWKFFWRHLGLLQDALAAFILQVDTLTIMNNEKQVNYHI